MENEMKDDGQVHVRPVQLEELRAADQATGGEPLTGSLDLIYDVRVRLRASVGEAQVSIGELYALKDGAVLQLDKATDDPVDIFLDGKLVARGELMVAGENFAIRITALGSKP